MIYTHVAAAILGAVVAATGAWQTQNWRYGTEIAKLKQKHSDEVSANAAKALEDYTRMERTKNEAIKAANARADANKAAAAGARAAADSLRSDLASVPARIESATREAVNQYATTVSGLLDQCSARYTGMAEKAQGHASDVRTLMEAWPK